MPHRRRRSPAQHARWSGASVKAVQAPILARTPSEVFDSVAHGVTPRTKVIALSHFTNTAGLMYPVAEIAALARRRNIWLHVDGAQTFGWLRLRLNALGADSYTGSFHKWPMGPLEAGLLATLETHLRIGPAEIERRTLEIAAQLRTALAALPNLELRSSGEPAVCGPAIKVMPKHRDLKPLYDELWTRHRVAIAMTASGPPSGLRFSPHIYNTPSEVERIASLLRR